MLKEGYKECEIGVIPEDWEVVKLDSLGKIITGSTPKTSNQDFYINGTRLWASPSDLGKSKEIKTTKTKLSDLGFEQIRVLEKRSILITCIGSTIGKMGIAYEEMSSNQQINAITCNQYNNPDFYYYVLFKIKDKIQKLAGTQAVPLLNKTDFSQIKVIQPPLKEQEKIADILSTADEKIDAIEGQIQKAETLKKGLLQKLLSKGIGHSEFKDSELGKIPEGWEVVPFLELADKKINYSFTGGPFGSDLKSEHYTKDGVRVIQLQNIGDGSFINNDFVYTSEEKVEALKTCQIYPNDIILAKMAEPVARACIMPSIEEKYLMGSDGIRLHIDKSKYDTHFILHSINFTRFRDIAVARSTGTTRLRIGLTALKKIPIVIPPLKEQKQISDILSTADEKIEVLRVKKQKYETLKKGLLQKLLSGEIRVEI